MKLDRSLINSILYSWMNDGNINSTKELIKWINDLNENTYVNINECSINDSEFWFYDNYNGEILNKKRKFFSIKGIRYFENNKLIGEQPIIIQPEIGYLGIICKEINGVLNFLMQGKIEPGNINCIQISPTIQATKSNFTRVHGGKFPSYFEYFQESDKYDVLFDQIQSEQSSRFYKKRNRNIIIKINKDIKVYPNFKWMTLGQIKNLMEIDNIVNMDTRTVISGIPLIIFKNSNIRLSEIKKLFKDKSFYYSIFKTDPLEELSGIYQKINNYKMFKDISTEIISLNDLADWKVDEYGVTCKMKADFMVRYYDIEISGREVHRWTQPLFKAAGNAVLGLITKRYNGIRKFLVRIKGEIGSFDNIELGPSIQWELTHYVCNDDAVERLFRYYIENQKGILHDVLLSEEGGRFYHEQNQNIIIEIDQTELITLPSDYLWVSYSTLNYLVQINNCLNIQLRNLLSLLKL